MVSEDNPLILGSVEALVTTSDCVQNTLIIFHRCIINISQINLFKVLERQCSVRGWRSLLEQRRRLLGLFTRAQLCVFGKLSKEHCLATVHMVRRILFIYRKSNALFTAQYLKHVALHVMWYWGGDMSKKPSMKTFVSLKKSGIPTFIPPFSRRRLRERSNPLIVRKILTICTLSRLIVVWPKGKKVYPKTIHRNTCLRIPLWSGAQLC